MCAAGPAASSSGREGQATRARHVYLLLPAGAGKLHTVNLEDLEVRKADA